VSCGNYFDMID